MISHTHQCIFVHIPKTGGTSIEDVIWGRNRTRRTSADLWMDVNEAGFNKYQSGGLQHLFARHIRQEVGSPVFDAFFKFSFVRNPWDRAVSQFAFMKDRSRLREWAGLRRDSSFKEYLDRVGKVRHVQWAGQWEFLLDHNGEMLVDFFGRFENLENDFRSVLSRVGIRCDSIPHEYRSNRSRYTHYYDTESMEIVQERYRRDIELFGYAYN